MFMQLNNSMISTVYKISFPLLICLFVANCSAQDHSANPQVQTKAAAAPTQQEKSASEELAALDEPLRKLLEKVDAAGEKYNNIQAGVIYTEQEVVFGERSTYSGKVYYSKPDNDKTASFRIHLDKLRSGGRTSEEDRDYVFFDDENGQWFTVRNAKIKQITKYHVAAPGQQTDPLELGKGPFPVPFGQDSEKVVKMFDLSMRAATETEPANTQCVTLKPKGDTAEKLSVSLIKMWVNDIGMPVRIEIDDLAGEVRKSAEFRRIDTSKKIDPDTFKLPWPGALSDWESHIEPLKKQD